ncbi:MAG TPA: hypothetical protein PLO37_02130 [Candidatus Hydrogenedentes bacterium]|nr:hypothetical protein [Candidatus Hydrogenedentota bacterium]HPG65616.1 hypothetical protein [Candidatus Hydrogenedentota bacterium]
MSATYGGQEFAKHILCYPNRRAVVVGRSRRRIGENEEPNATIYDADMGGRLDAFAQFTVATQQQDSLFLAGELNFQRGASVGMLMRVG